MNTHLPETKESVYPRIDHFKQEQLPVSRALLIERFDCLLDRVEGLVGEGAVDGADYVTNPLRVNRRETLQIFMFRPRPHEPDADFTPNYYPSITIQKSIRDNNSLQGPQVVRRYKYLSKKNLREKTSDDEAKSIALDEALAERTEEIELGIALYEKHQNRQVKLLRVKNFLRKVLKSSPESSS